MHEEAGMRPIYGKRVTLRPWQRGDTLSHELWPRYSEPFSSLWNIPHMISYNDVVGRGWSSQRYVWAVVDSARRLIGRISLREVDPKQGSARLGISLAQPHVGQGLGSEAMALFLDHYFGPLGFAQLNLDVAAFNLRAVRCYERLGFTYRASEWRSAGNDPALRLLDDPRYSDLAQFFRRDRHTTLIEFYEMVLPRASWLAPR